MPCPDIVSQRPIVGDFNGPMKVVFRQSWEECWALIRIFMEHYISTVTKHCVAPLLCCHKWGGLSCTVG